MRYQLNQHFLSKIISFNIFEGDTKYFNTLSAALDARKMNLKDHKSIYKSFIQNHLKKLDKKYNQLTKQKFDAENLLLDKDKGDYIYSHGKDLQSKLQFIDDISLDERKTLS